MLRLILMRHAKSDWGNLQQSDHDRPLNRRGRASAKALGDWMKAQAHAPDEVLCSSAERTQDTLAGLDLAPSVSVRFLRELYHADPHQMFQTLRSAEAPCVLMLGHNPGIAEFAQALVAAPPAHPRFDDYPTGATLVCEIDESCWADVGPHSAKAIDFVIPRELMTAG